MGAYVRAEHRRRRRAKPGRGLQMPPLAGNSRQMKGLPPPTPPRTGPGSAAGAHVQTAKPQRDRQPPAGGSTRGPLLPWTSSKRLARR